MPDQNHERPHQPATLADEEMQRGDRNITAELVAGRAHPGDTKHRNPPRKPQDPKKLAKLRSFIDSL